MINHYMDFYSSTVFDQSSNFYQFPYNIHNPMNLLFEKKVEDYYMITNNENNNNNNTMKRKYDQVEENDLFLYPYQSDNYILDDFKDMMEIKKENDSILMKQQINKRHKSSSSSSSTNTILLKNEQTLSIPSPTNTVKSTMPTKNNNKPTEYQKDIIKLENNLHYLQDEWATIDIVLNSLRSVFTVYPTKLSTDEYLDDIDKELSIAYDDLMAQVRSLDRNLKRLDVKIKSCHDDPIQSTSNIHSTITSLPLANVISYSDFSMPYPSFS